MAYNFSSFKEEIKKIEEWLAKEFSQLHTGRATPSLLDGVSVDSYGSMSPIVHVAAVSIEDPRTLRVSPWDKTQVKAIEKAIISQNLGLSVSVDDAGLRVSFPALTTETRVKLTKIVRDRMEDARVSVRSEREKFLKDIEQKEKDGELSEDEKFRCKEELQKLVDEANSKLEDLTRKKEADIMS